MISKAMVEIVSFFWSQPYPLLGPIIPEIKNPKKFQENLTMVIHGIGHINEIE